MSWPVRLGPSPALVLATQVRRVAQQRLQPYLTANRDRFHLDLDVADQCPTRLQIAQGGAQIALRHIDLWPDHGPILDTLAGAPLQALQHDLQVQLAHTAGQLLIGLRILGDRQRVESYLLLLVEHLEQCLLIGSSPGLDGQARYRTASLDSLKTDESARRAQGISSRCEAQPGDQHDRSGQSDIEPNLLAGIHLEQSSDMLLADLAVRGDKLHHITGVQPATVDARENMAPAAP